MSISNSFSYLLIEEKYIKYLQLVQIIKCNNIDFYVYFSYLLIEENCILNINISSISVHTFHILLNLNKNTTHLPTHYTLYCPLSLLFIH